MNSAPFTPGVPPAGGHPKRERQALRHLAKLAVAIGAFGLLACDEDSGLERGIVIGKIDFDDPTWQFPDIPETAADGVPLGITVWTGGSGCHEYGHTGGGANFFEEPGTAEITLWYTDGGAARREDHLGDGRKVYTVQVLPAG